MFHGLAAILPNVENWVGKAKQKKKTNHHQNEGHDSVVQLKQAGAKKFSQSKKVRASLGLQSDGEPGLQQDVKTQIFGLQDLGTIPHYLPSPKALI